jgi:probable HAF family extracellular repeat protein
MKTKTSIDLSRPSSVVLALVLCGHSVFGQSSIAKIMVPGAVSLTVSGLNASGAVAGYFQVPAAGQRAFFWSNGSAIDLNTLGGSMSVANGLNNFGQVIGYSSSVGDAEFHAFFAIGRTLFDLGTLGGAVSSAAAINDAGEVTGYSYVSPFGLDYHAFVTDDAGLMIDLGTLGGSTSFGAAINGLGQIVGDSAIAGNSASHAFLHDGTTMRNLGTLGGLSSSAYALNDSGQIVGESSVAGEAATHAFMSDGIVMRDLGTLGGTYSGGYAINGAGQVIGDSALAGDVDYHGFIYSNGVLNDLGTLGGRSSSAWAINNLGQVVGVSSDTSSRERAYLWQNGTMADLNTLLPANSGWELTGAFFINDKSQIVGTGVFQGQASWYLMAVGLNENQPPVANAGLDQRIECDSTMVSLDGSNSTDPNGDVLTYQWFEGSVLLSNTVAPTISLANGSHTLILRVTDSHGVSSEDTVLVVVGDTVSPVVLCPVPQQGSANDEGQAFIPGFLNTLLASDNCTAASALVKEQSPAPGSPVGCGTHEVILAVADSAGNRTTCTTTFTVVDVTSPVVRCPAQVTVSTGAKCEAAVPDLSTVIFMQDNCTPTGELVFVQEPTAGTPLEKGAKEARVTVTDTAGNVSTAMVLLNVVDLEPPTILQLTATPNVLNPANRKMMGVTLSAVVEDNCDPNVVTEIVSVTSSEAVTGPGDNTAPDWNITGALTVDLRSEVTSKSSPRVYTIKLSCTDVSGNTRYRSVCIKVNKDKRLTVDETTAKVNPGKKK